MPRTKPKLTIKYSLRMTGPQNLHICEQAKHFGISEADFVRFLITADMKLKQPGKPKKGQKPA